MRKTKKKEKGQPTVETVYKTVAIITQDASNITAFIPKSFYQLSIKPRIHTHKHERGKRNGVWT